MKTPQGMGQIATRLFVLLFLCTSGFASDLVPFTRQISGTVSEGIIFYQTDNFFVTPNPLNPVNIEIISMQNSSTLNVCYNYLQATYPVSGAGANMPNCPQGAFIPLSAAPSSPSVKKLFRKYSEKLQSLRSALQVEDTNGTEIYISPSYAATGGFIVAPALSTTITNFQIQISGMACELPNEYPDNGTCSPIDSFNLPNQISIPPLQPNNWKYYLFTIDSFSPIINNIATLSISSTSVSTLYIQQSYIPSNEWYLATAAAGQTIQIYTPSYLFGKNQNYFIGIYNPTTSVDSSIVLSVNLSSCANSTNFGYNCQVNLVESSSEPLLQINQISASLTLNENEQTSVTNNGTALVFSQYSSSTYAGQYLYFSITNIPADLSAGSALRIGVGNNDHNSNAPNLYAKLNGYPSSYSYDYAVYGSSVSSQLVIPITPTDQWFLAVELPSDFSIWVGTNCANNCSDQEHGDCSCSTTSGTVSSCATIVGSNNTNIQELYIFPTNIGDSSGLCTCEDDLFGGFQCTDVLSYKPVIVIFVVTVVTAIILVLVIAIPSYVYLNRKKKMLYEQL